MTGVVLDGLGIGYPGKRPVVIAEALAATARNGELTALVGPNGGGKSTLLRTICGLQPPLTGRVLLADGTDLASLRGTALARRVAVVLTDVVFPGRLTAGEVVALGRTPYLGLGGGLGTHDREVVSRTLAALHVEHLAGQAFHALSDGQRQRILSARALAQEPELLVLDEPTSYLDAPSRVELLDLLRALAHDHGIAVLLSSHEVELTLQVADQLWLLEGSDLASGSALTTGTPTEVAASGRLGAAFDRGRFHFDPSTLSFRLEPTRDDTPTQDVVPD